MRLKWLCFALACSPVSLVPAECLPSVPCSKPSVHPASSSAALLREVRSSEVRRRGRSTAGRSFMPRSRVVGAGRAVPLPKGGSSHDR
jgi:hypothetical protein